MPPFEPFEAFSDIDDLAEKLKDQDESVRRVAVMELADTAEPAAIALIGSALKDPSAEVRLQAAIALGEFDGAECAAMLAIDLVDSDNRVARAAADSLAELKDPDAADPIFPLIEHENPLVRAGALRGVKELRRTESLPYALRALNDDDPQVRNRFHEWVSVKPAWYEICDEARRFPENPG